MSSTDNKRVHIDLPLTDNAENVSPKHQLPTSNRRIAFTSGIKGNNTSVSMKQMLAEAKIANKLDKESKLDEQSDYTFSVIVENSS